jgi:hypothetical protein
MVGMQISRQEMGGDRIRESEKRMITSQLTDDKQVSVSDLKMFLQVSFRHHCGTRWMPLCNLTDF